MKVKRNIWKFMKTKKKALEHFFRNGVKNKQDFAIRKYGRKKLRNIK